MEHGQRRSVDAAAAQDDPARHGGTQVTASEAGDERSESQHGASAGTHQRNAPTAMSPAQRKASVIAALLLLVAGVFTLKGFLPALVWAAIFAIGLWPLREYLYARWPAHRRTLLPMALTLATLLIFVIPLTLIVVPLIHDAHAAGAWLAQARESGIPAPPALASLPFGAKLIELWQSSIG